MTAGSRLDSLIIGAGPTGIGLALRLRGAGLRDLLVVEKGRAVDTWDSALAGTSPTRTGLYFSDTICAEDHAQPPLVDYARGHPAMTAELCDLDYLPKEVLQDYYRDAASAAGVPVRPGVTVRAVRPDGGGFAAELASGETIRTRTLVDATGIVWSKNWPAQVADLPEDRKFHSIGHGVLHGAVTGRRILVIGGGHATPDIAVRMAEGGALVTISTWQSRFRTQLLPYPSEFLSERFQARFRGCPAAERYRLLARMSGLGPWVTPRSYRDLVSFLRGQDDGRAGQIEVALSNTVTMISGGPDGLIADLSCGWRRTFDYVICATGFTAQFPRRTAYSWPEGFWRDRTYGGFPLLSDDYEVPGVPGLFFVGYLAQLGPRGPVDSILYDSQPTIRTVARAVTAHVREQAGATR